jgi:hypothetical protein
VKRKLFIAALAAAALALPLSAQDANALLAGSAIPGSAETLSASVTLRIYGIDGSFAKREVRYLAQSREGRTSKLAQALSPEWLEDGKFLSAADGAYVYGRSRGMRALSSSDASRAFLGSNLSFEDLAAPNPAATRNRLVGSELAAGRDCYIVESLGEAGSQYAKALRWVAKDGGLLIKAELFNAKGKAVKSVAVTSFDSIDGRLCARGVEVKDLAHGSSTTLEFKDIRFGAALPADIFSPAALATASL